MKKPKGKAARPAVKKAGKPAAAKRSAAEHHAILSQKVQHHRQRKISASKISTSELEKMKAFGILPFELRKELHKRLSKK